MTTKAQIRCEIKEVSDAGTFEGLLSPYSNIDQGGDVVEPGAYTKTLQEQGVTRPLLWQHKSDAPIGELTLQDRADGLWCVGKLLLDLPDAQKAYTCLKAGIVKGLSIGFESLKDSMVSGVRHLKEIKLYEGSLVTFPMNEMAQVASVKAGRMISASNVETLRKACDALMGAHKDISALFDEEAGEKSTTPEPKAAEKPKPALDHLAKRLHEMRSLIPN